MKEHKYKFEERPAGKPFAERSADETGQEVLNSVPWVNYYAINDPISGRLDYYTVDLNIKIDLPEKWGVAHLGYWKSKTFYADIVKRFLQPPGSERITRQIEPIDLPPIE